MLKTQNISLKNSKLHPEQVDDQRWNKNVIWVCKNISYGLSLIAILLSILVFIGHSLDVYELVRLDKDLPATMPNTALGIFFLAMATIFYNTLKRTSLEDVFHTAASLCVYVTLFLSVFTLLEYLFVINISIDQLFLNVLEKDNSYPGRPSAQTAITMTLICIGALGLNKKNDQNFTKFLGTSYTNVLGQFILLIALIFLYFVIISYLFHIESVIAMPQLSTQIGIAIPTVAGLLLVTIALLLGHPLVGFLKLVTGHLRANQLFRTLGFLILTVPIFATVFVDYLQLKHGISPQIKGGIFIMLTVTVLFVSLLYYALSLQKIESQKNRTRYRLHAMVERYENLLNSAADGVMIVDQNAIIVQVNEQLSQWTGYERKFLIGKSIELLIPDTFKDKHRLIVDQFMKQSIKISLSDRINLCLRKKDKTTLPVEISLSPHMFEDKLYVTTVIRDITEKRKKQRQLEHKLATINLLHKITLAINENRSIEHAVYLCLKYITHFIQFDFAHLVNVDNDKNDKNNPKYHDSNVWFSNHQHINQLDQILKSKKQIIDCLFKNQANIHRLYILDQNSPQISFSPRKKELFTTSEVKKLIVMPIYVNGDNEALLEFYTTRPKKVTKESKKLLKSIATQMGRLYERRDKRKLLENAVKVRELTLAKVSHDLKNPLSSIMGGTRLLSKKLKARQNALNNQSFNYKSIKEIIEIIEHASSYMLSLINDLLDFSKMEAKKYQLKLTAISINKLIQDSVNMVEEQARKKNIKLGIEWKQQKTCLVYASEHELKRAITNLLNNAIKFSPDHSQVTIKYFNEEDNTIVSIIDEGKGIEPKEVKNIFETYWQQEGVKEQGTGLGLAITKGIIEAHGGTIGVVSNPGRGSTFYFSLKRVSELPVTDVTQTATASATAISNIADSNII